MGETGDPREGKIEHENPIKRSHLKGKKKREKEKRKKKREEKREKKKKREEKREKKKKRRETLFRTWQKE